MSSPGGRVSPYAAGGRSAPPARPDEAGFVGEHHKLGPVASAERDPALPERLAGFEAAIGDTGATAHRLIPNDRVPPTDQFDVVLEYLRTHSAHLPTAAQ